MSNNASVKVVRLNHERVTNSILRKASRRASTVKRGTTIVVKHDYKCRSEHDDVIRLLLTKKVRTTPTPLQYRGTYRGEHTFLVP